MQKQELILLGSVASLFARVSLIETIDGAGTHEIGSATGQKAFTRQSEIGKTLTIVLLRLSPRSQVEATKR